MIVGLKGKISNLEIGCIYLETSVGITYEVSISYKTFDLIKKNNRTELDLFIYHHITDRVEKLFGFMSFKDRELFKLIRSLNGIGEMTALKILSYLDASELYNAVLNGDQSVLEKIPKVKGKTSEKIIFEVKQNIKKLEQFLSDTDKKTPMNENDITVQALIQLGFDEKSAIKDVERVTRNEKTKDPSELIRLILSGK